MNLSLLFCKNDDDEQQVEPQTQQTTDPRNDPKYDSIDWQDENSDKNLTIEETDEILEEQQNEEQEQSGNNDQQEQDTANNGSEDDGNLLRKTVKNKITIKRKAMTMDQIATTTND